MTSVYVVHESSGVPPGWRESLSKCLAQCAQLKLTPNIFTLLGYGHFCFLEWIADVAQTFQKGFPTHPMSEVAVAIAIQESERLMQIVQ